jgi:hypothetical protein
MSAPYSSVFQQKAASPSTSLSEYPLQALGEHAVHCEQNGFARLFKRLEITQIIKLHKN